MRDETAILILGRNGDIVNSLPIARHLSLESGKPIPFVVSAQFAKVLLGVSYVEIDKAHFQWHRVDQGMKYAQAKYARVVCAQVWSRYYGNMAAQVSGISYNVAMWVACSDVLQRTLTPHVTVEQSTHGEPLQMRERVSEVGQVLPDLSCGTHEKLEKQQPIDAGTEGKIEREIVCESVPKEGAYSEGSLRKVREQKITDASCGLLKAFGSDLALPGASLRASQEFAIAAFRDLERYPLVFDRRDKEREDFLCRQVIHGVDKPLLLYSLGCAGSSPFASHHVVKEAIERRWGDTCHCVNLCDVKAARIYDLLGLFDRAAVLITADTSALHLAAASKVPVVCFVNDNAWLATTPRCKVVFKTTYSEALARIKEIHATIAGQLKNNS